MEWAHLDIPIYADSAPRGNASDPAVFPQLLPPNPAGFRHQWGAKRIGLPVAWSIATGAVSKERAVTVCVVDSGVDFT